MRIWDLHCMQPCPLGGSATSTAGAGRTPRKQSHPSGVIALSAKGLNWKSRPLDRMPFVTKAQAPLMSILEKGGQDSLVVFAEAGQWLGS